MGVSSIFLLSSIICVSGPSFQVKADVIVWDNNFPWSNASTILSVDYEKDCVNIDPEWMSKRSSIDTNNACVTFYQESNCKGNSINLVSNQTFFPFLSEVRFVRQAASFKRCNNSDQPLQMERPQYNFILHARSQYESRYSRVYSIESGVCKTLPSDWYYGRQVKFYTVYEAPIALFPDAECGNKSWRGYPNFNMSPKTYSRGSPVKSVRILDLKYTTASCDDCAFLHPGSKEYVFWYYLFFFSNDSTHLNKFEQLVNNSKDGFIPWDFLFTSDPSSHTTAAVDIDAIQSYIHLFGSSRPSALKKLGFTRDHRRFLARLAYDVYLERLDQNNSVEDDEKQLFKFYINLWMKIYTILRPSVQKVAFVEHRNYSIRLYGRGGTMEYLTLGNSRCRTLPTKWQDRIEEISLNGHCFVLFEKENCEGLRHWAMPPADELESSLALMGKRLSRNDRATKSIKVCDLTFHESCTQCPKLFDRGSFEYRFWKSFNQIYFTRRNSESSGFKDDLIRWENIMKSSATGDQFLVNSGYRLAFERLFFILRSIRDRSPEVKNFTVNEVETLHSLVAALLKERQEQSGKIDDRWETGDIVTMEQLNWIWISVKTTLNDLMVNWERKEILENECGQVESDTFPRLIGAEKAVPGMDPWHAAIYRNLTGKNGTSEYLHICSATLISPTVLISAAHCFYDKGYGVALNNTSEYMIALGKYTSNYYSSSVHDKSQRYHAVKDLVFHTNGYDPEATGTEGSDIILIILQEPAEFNSVIRPICIDEDKTIFGNSYDDNNMGRVVGWGATEDEGTSNSPYLMTADLRYLSFTECKRKVRPLSIDKFCARSEKGAGPSYGDSGGGLIFKRHGRYYVRGVVSERDVESTDNTTAFTDLAIYTHWIREYMK